MPAPKAKPTPEEMRKVNERKRIRKLYWIIATNFDFGDLHMQLTYRPRERPTPDEAKRLLKNFLRRLREEYKKRGKPFKYIVTTEYKQKFQAYKGIREMEHFLIINYNFRIK